MRRVDKGAPPHCLAALRREARRVERDTGRAPTSRDWAPGACAQPIRDALHRDQYGLCGYCTQSIHSHGHHDHPPPLGNGGMRIEHLCAREAEPGRMYDWSNLLGVCGGVSGAPGGEVYIHCDRARGSRPLDLNPAGSLPVESMLRWSRRPPDGVSDRGDSVWLVASDARHQSSIELLNLNNPALRRQRRAAVHEIARLLDKHHRRGRSIPSFLRELEVAASSPGPQGTLPSFAPVVLQYVQRKLRAYGGPGRAQP